jgi:hypothetical protein
MKKKTICFDIDNVICLTKNSNYRKSLPIKSAIKKINELFNNGHKIILFTARFMGRTKQNKKQSHKLGYNLTKKQLNSWGVKYNKLIMGKPSYDLIIDDLSIYFKKTWYKDIDQKL